MRKQKLTDKQMLYMIIGKLTVKFIEGLIVSAMFVGLMVATLNNMTVYR